MAETADDTAETLPAEPDSLVGDLELGPPALAPPRRVHVEFSRELTEADLAALALNRQTKPKSLLRIHSSHHALARCIATGMKHHQVAQVTGYTTVRIGQLINDETFKALVADYKAEISSVVADLAVRMSNVSLDAIEVLQERLHDEPGAFSVSMLLDVVKTFADRTGHGPGQDVTLRVEKDFVDRPPRETYEEWRDRRMREVTAQAPTEAAHGALGPTAHTSERPTAQPGPRTLN